MALSDFLGLTDDSLSDTYQKEAFDAARARGTLTAQLDKASQQFAASGPQRGRKMYSVNNGVVKLRLPVAIDGKTEFLIPSERFADAVDKLKNSIASGELDQQLESSAGGERAQQLGSSGGTNGAGDARGRRRRVPMSDEAKAAMTAKRRATMEARGIKPGPRGARG